MRLLQNVLPIINATQWSLLHCVVWLHTCLIETTVKLPLFLNQCLSKLVNGLIVVFLGGGGG